MRRRFLPCLFMLSLSPPASGATQSQPEFFPFELHAPAIECLWGKRRVKLPVLSDFEDRWFSKQLSAANEPSLFEQSLKQPGGIAGSYRFTWLRTFHAPIMIRIDERLGGGMYLTAERLTGRGGYDPGHVGSAMRRPLTAQESEDVRRMFAASDFATFRANLCDRGTDGAVWLLETRIGGKYRVINQFSPANSPVRRIGMALLLLTGWKNEAVY
jgi:hypothetical protein